jgi:hypothetical protein
MSKTKDRKWDGKSRVSNDVYRKRYNEIFKKMTDDNAEKFIHTDEAFGKKEDDELKESYEQSKRNRSDRANDE